MAYRAILMDPFKPRKCARQPMDCKYLHRPAIN